MELSILEATLNLMRDLPSQHEAFGKYSKNYEYQIKPTLAMGILLTINYDSMQPCKGFKEFKEIANLSHLYTSHQYSE